MQVTLAVALALATNATGCVIVDADVKEQPLASVIVIVYVAALKLDAVVLEPPLGAHEYV